MLTFRKLETVGSDLERNWSISREKWKRKEMMRSILEKTNSRKKRNLRNTITDSLKTRECYFERKKNIQMFVLLLFSCSVMSDSVTSRTAARQASLSITNSRSLLKLMSVVPFSCLQSFPASRFFFNESAFHIGWPKCWSFSFSISPSSEYSVWFPLGLTGLISLQAKGLSSLLQHHSSKASILWYSFRHISTLRF